MNRESSIVFVCEHGAAKSIIAAAYFNKLAHEAKLGCRAIARGTRPEAALSPATVAGLHQDGLTPAEDIPRKLSLADVEAAQRIIAFCELPDDFQQRGMIEQWDGIPPVSTNYELARDALLERIHRLMNTLS